ncbi:FHA domain-containing protein [Schaalia georgiae]|uniref:FHA domain-containing protein n=2 Tax=Schaalia georgiae TaxID=52768 RepID=A0A929MY99_9ACTO|nr:FHA domain-containing protein [Schaalia georgiae]EJF48067.1 putative oxoglutarate dehydrogenase inhibitor [Schaalia georgiae F0490]MBF0939429.1 FHA domain-containing protein [Schaalia georgiae]RRR27423.1 FHA domain-containing protein [Schaalia georgiae]
MEPQQDFDPTATSVFGITPVPDDSEETPVVLSARDREAVSALPAGSALLIVQRGPNTGARFLLDPNVTNAGRSPKADIFLDDVTVSRKHCQFIADNGGHIVRDSGSLNGTYVNRERVDQACLSAGDEVQIGKYRLTYQPSPHEA